MLLTKMMGICTPPNTSSSSSSSSSTSFEIDIVLDMTWRDCIATRDVMLRLGIRLD